uniref:NADH-ubiquinone oxidoreductase chain 2 n=1 Tax=Epimeria cornigera TaxID=1582882 RepID=A0A2S1TMC4_9CRUS|nr:NADH dehydrogenase subunit 2 [Epimeria cornigera]
MMYFHPSHILFFSSLVLAIIMGLSSNSLFIMWLSMEATLLSFIPLTLKKNKYSTESSIKYFLIQSLASILFIMGSILTPLSYLISPFLLKFSLLMKMGAAPTHQWMPPVAEGMSWTSFYLLVTSQKIIPLTMYMFITKYQYLYSMSLTFIIMSALIGSLMGLNQTSLQKILVYSSISHMSWLLTATLMNNFIWIMYFLLYSFVLMSVIIPFHFNSIFSINQMISKNKNHLGFFNSLALLSLGGMPPFTGFIPKLIMTTELTKMSYSFLLFPLLTSTFISLFFYIRMVLLSILSSLTTTYSENIKHSLTLTSIINLTGLLAPSILLLT